MTNLTQILFSYDFLVVAIGTVLLAIPSAIVGCFSVYKGQSLMADAVGHASYPGVVIAFMLFSVRSSVILTLGAAVVGILAYLTIQMIRKHSVIDFDGTRDYPYRFLWAWHGIKELLTRKLFLHACITSGTKELYLWICSVYHEGRYHHDCNMCNYRSSIIGFIL